MVKSSRNKQRESVRIIGGRWRGSKLPVVDVPGLRPTSDRVRETIFNWLAADIVDARCVDLFAGTGVLGLEALSRGAASVIAVEKDKSACRELQSNAERLSAGSYELQCADAFIWLGHYADPIDILFLDPPFDLNAWDALSELIASANNFSEGSLIYLEQPKKTEPWRAPCSWCCVKTKTAGDVRFELYLYEGAVQRSEG